MRANPLGYWSRLVSRLGQWWRRGRPELRLSRSERAAVLLEACLNIRTAQFQAAQGILLQLDTHDAARLNLLGVIWELHRDWPRARKLYGQAIRADRQFAAPRQNLQRWYELVTLGASSIPMCLGDEDPQWWCERPQSRAANHRAIGMLLAAKGGLEIYRDN